ncbi:MAG: ABC transporter ATP-binding protein [Rhodanobacteraceae bacterium]|nr:ABC transporter ATP-binding protein [Rhodanobacteraceae bacterium]MBP9154872.1 ABC transporter ATP-binding protein [Xanthomonadales bacterium]HQW81325.1 ABC transporter ATP-binding protein [Pseudomonadota bacterium]
MIRIDSVRKQFGSIVALDGLTLDVRPGEMFGLLGPNGAGKSTTMALLTGLHTPDAGSISVLGGDPRDPALRARLGLAPQSLALYENLSGRENVTFFARMFGLRGARLDQRVDAALDFVQLVDRQHDRVGGYSGGMQRRLNLAAALVHEPELILLDEPTAGVDPQSRNALFENVLALKAAGRTIVYTTHYMEEVERLCDRVAIIDRGRVLAVDSVAGLLRAHAGAPVLVVEREGRSQRIETTDPLAELNRLAASAPIDGFHVERPRLEQVFLHLTGRSLRD